MSTGGTTMKNHRAINALLLLAVVVLMGAALVVGAPRSGGGEGEKFGGTDAAVSEMIEESGYEPWFAPLFSPDSGEIESGLFALQAALGAGFLGYCIGVLRGRRQTRREHDPAPAHPTGPDPQASPTT